MKKYQLYILIGAIVLLITACVLTIIFIDFGNDHSDESADVGISDIVDPSDSEASIDESSDSNGAAEGKNDETPTQDVESDVTETTDESDEPTDSESESLTESSSAAETSDAAKSTTVTSSPSAPDPDVSEPSVEAEETCAHVYSNATCTAPQTCIYCSETAGPALGHGYAADGKCATCGIKDSSATFQDFTVSVKNEKSLSVKGVGVSVYDFESMMMLGEGHTDSKGAFTCNVKKCDKYKIILSDVPAEYAAEDSYIAASTSKVNIKLKYNVVVDPDDHSLAGYKVGSAMWDFTVSDTDGNSYNLATLLSEKKLIILDFWYVSCAPCKAEFPYFDSAIEKYGDDICLLAMNHFDSVESIKKLKTDMGVSFPMVKESLGLREAFNIQNYPTTVIINGDGKIISIHIGAFDSEEAFLNAIEMYIK